MIKIKGHLGQPGHGVEEKELGCIEFGKEDNLFHMSLRWQSTTFNKTNADIPIYLTFTRYGQEEAEDLKKVGRGKREGRGRWRGRGSGQKN